MKIPTIEKFVGNTPLVRLQRIAGDTSNLLLGKLEGNNPAGSVKDRPALSMIAEAELRGEIKPGDCLIEATSGNTGIALAMVAAMKGYRMILIMPENMSLERRASMQAFGAELILVTAEEGMEGSRDLALKMQAEGQGKVLDQFANPDNPLSHYRTTGPEIWRDTEGRITHFVSSMGTTGTVMGTSKYLKENESRDPDHWSGAVGGIQDPRYPKVAGGLYPQDIRCQCLGPADRRDAAGSRGHDAAAGQGGRHLLRDLFRGSGRGSTEGE